MATRRPSRGPNRDINVTPLVDVVLVLLIIFMVITPMLQRGADVQLPLTKHPKKAKSIDEQITITVKKEGDLFWEAQAISDADLAARLSQTFSKMPTAPIFVKGDVGANYGRVRQVMKLIQDAGFPKVGVITKELKGASGEEGE